MNWWSRYLERTGTRYVKLKRLGRDFGDDMKDVYYIYSFNMIGADSDSESFNEDELPILYRWLKANPRGGKYTYQIMKFATRQYCVIYEWMVPSLVEQLEAILNPKVQIDGWLAVEMREKLE